MNAPVIWILVPALSGVLLFLLPVRLRYMAGIGISFGLAFLAQILPIDRIFQLANWQIKIAPAFSLLGRQLVLQDAHRNILFLLYLLLGLWLISARTLQADAIFPTVALIIQSALLAALAVQPFLYAAPIMTLASLLMAFFFGRHSSGGTGLKRFLILQIIALPPFLLSGWLLAGVESAPADTQLALQAGLLLASGILMLLPAFPFQTWLPSLADEVPPYALAFWLFIFPTSTFFLILNFSEHYVWLRENTFVFAFLRQAGLLTLLSGGLLAAYQKNVRRLLAYNGIALNGITLLALTLPQSSGIAMTLLLFLPRGILFLLGGENLTRLTKDGAALQAIQGKARTQPFVSAAAVTAFLALGGLPLYVTFPIYRTLWLALAHESTWQAVVFGLSLSGLLIGALRTAAVLLMNKENTPWHFRQNWKRLVWVFSLSLLPVLLAIFPQWLQLILPNLPAILPHLTG